MREGRKERETPTSLYYLWRPVGQNSSGQERKFTYSTRVMHGTTKEEFHQRSKKGDLGESKFSELGGVFETSFGSSMLQELGILLTLVYFPL